MKGCLAIQVLLTLSILKLVMKSFNTLTIRVYKINKLTCDYILQFRIREESTKHCLVPFVDLGIFIWCKLVSIERISTPQYFGHNANARSCSGVVVVFHFSTIILCTCLMKVILGSCSFSLTRSSSSQSLSRCDHISLANKVYTC